MRVFMRVSKFLLFLSAVLCAAAPASADTPLGVVINLGFPASVQMFAGGDPEPARTQDAPVAYDLTNLTDGMVTLKANSDCEAHSWTVTDASGTVVDNSGACPQMMQPVTLDVAVGKPVSAQATVSLHVFDYKEGQNYTIHYKVFGLEGTAVFTVSLLK
jgi:hypothetical protein